MNTHRLTYAAIHLRQPQRWRQDLKVCALLLALLAAYGWASWADAQQTPTAPAPPTAQLGCALNDSIFHSPERQP